MYPQRHEGQQGAIGRTPVGRDTIVPSQGKIGPVDVSRSVAPLVVARSSGLFDFRGAKGEWQVEVTASFRIGTDGAQRIGAPW